MAVIAKHQRQQYEDRDLWDKFWKDKDGNVVVWQTPNMWLIAWVVLTLASLFINGTVSYVLWYASLAALAIWAIREIWKGVNYLRKGLGAVILLLIILALFKVGY